MQVLNEERKLPKVVLKTTTKSTKHFHNSTDIYICKQEARVKKQERVKPNPQLQEARKRQKKKIDKKTNMPGKEARLNSRRNSL